MTNPLAAVRFGEAASGARIHGVAHTPAILAGESYESRMWRRQMESMCARLGLELGEVLRASDMTIDRQLRDRGADAVMRIGFKRALERVRNGLAP